MGPPDPWVVLSGPCQLFVNVPQSQNGLGWAPPCHAAFANHNVGWRKRQRRTESTLFPFPLETSPGMDAYQLLNVPCWIKHFSHNFAAASLNLICEAFNSRFCCAFFLFHNYTHPLSFTKKVTCFKSNKVLVSKVTKRVGRVRSMYHTPRFLNSYLKSNIIILNTRLFYLRENL